MAKRNGKFQRGGWISKSERLAIYLRDGFTCAYCGTDLHGAKPENVTLDHLTCRCNGGADDHANLVTACRSCNSSRGSRPWRGFAPGGAVERISRQRRRDMTRYRVMARAILAGRAAGEKQEC